MTVPVPPDNFGLASNCNQASVDYFIEVFGFEEAVQLSNIDNPTGNEINYNKIQIALNDAAQLINNYITSAPPQGRILIAGSFRRTQAVIARWYLDILRPREHVTLQAEKALQQLELWAAKGTPSDALKWQDAQRYWGSGCTMTRSTHNRGRSYTEPSLNRWFHREGNNDRSFPAPRRPARLATRGGPGARAAGVPDSTMGESTLEINKLVDALESTRTLDSFTNTRDAFDPEDQDMLQATNETEDPDGTFDNEYGGLTPEGEF